MIAFLRRYTDRSLQLCIADSRLQHISAVGQPELVSPDRPYTTSKSAKQTPQNIEWSPDDKAICYSRVEWFTFPDGEKLAATGLWKYTLATGSIEPLATHPKTYEAEFYFYHSPRWSPDGKRLAFLGSSLKGETALFVRTLAGTRPDTVTPRFDKYEDTGWPAWSPDGKYLAFRQRILRSISADPIETVRVIEPGGAFASTVFSSNDWIWELNRFRPRKNREWRDRAQFGVSGITWSPDGRKMAITTAAGLIQGDLWLIALNPLSATRIGPVDPSFEPGLTFPIWTSAYQVTALEAEPASDSFSIREFRLAPKNADGGICRLSSDDFDWSPNRASIVCASSGGSQPGQTTTLRIIPTALRTASR